MANWKMTIDVAEEWTELTNAGEEISKFREAKKKMLVRLRGHKKAVRIDIGNMEFYQFVGCLNRLSTSRTVAAFDKHWNHLYNWADRNKVWLQTVKI